MKKLAVACLMFASAAGCGSCGEESGQNGGNQGTNAATNNVGTNNGVTNGATNNVSTNNSSNSASNNGTTNNTSTNAATNNASTNSATNNSSTNNGTGEVPPAEIDDAISAMMCEALYECPNRITGELVFELGGYEDVQACIDAGPHPFVLRVFSAREIMAGVQRGRIAYDPVAMGECIDALKADLCNVLTPSILDGPPPAACEEALQGTVAQDGRCVHELDCSEGLQCEPTAGDCWGTCQPIVGDCGGDTCDADEYCRQMGMMCVPRTALGDTCNNRGECVVGAECNTALATPVCVENGSVAAGEQCAATESCEAGTICSTGTCEPLDFVGQDADCGPIAAGGIAVCEPALACLPSGIPMGTCLAPIEEGGSCEQHYHCAGDLVCLANQCSQPLPDGEFCADDELCASRYCNAANECATLPLCTLP